MLLLVLLSMILLKIAFCQNNPPAPVVMSNVSGSGYMVTLDSGPGKLIGSFYFIATIDQLGVQVSASVNGFNVTDDNTYTYHIHENLVPADGNCNATGEHFDPYHAGASYPCNPEHQDLCQLGDLSGKHGALHFDATAGIGSYSFTYFDDFLSTTPGSPAFFGDLSVVIHRKKDGLRIACGNLRSLGSAPASISGLVERVSSANGSTTYDSQPATVMSTVVTTATTYAIQSSPQSASMSTTVAIQTASSTYSIVPSTSSLPKLPTGVLQGSAASMVTVTRHKLMFALACIAAGIMA